MEASRSLLLSSVVLFGSDFDGGGGLKFGGELRVLRVVFFVVIEIVVRKR